MGDREQLVEITLPLWQPSLRIKPNRLHAFIGKRGSGKSVAMRHVLYSIRKHVQNGVCMSGTELCNEYFGSHIPASFIFDSYRPEVVKRLVKRQLKLKRTGEDPLKKPVFMLSVSCHGSFPSRPPDRQDIQRISACDPLRSSTGRRHDHPTGWRGPGQHRHGDSWRAQGAERTVWRIECVTSLLDAKIILCACKYAMAPRKAKQFSMPYPLNPATQGNYRSPAWQGRVELYARNYFTPSEYENIKRMSIKFLPMEARLIASQFATSHEHRKKIQRFVGSAYVYDLAFALLRDLKIAVQNIARQTDTMGAEGKHVVVDIMNNIRGWRFVKLTADGRGGHNPAAQFPDINVQEMNVVGLIT